MNNTTTLVSRLIQKKLMCPHVTAADKGDSKVLARQLDATLMQVGFKMSADLLKYAGGLAAPDALQLGSTVLGAVRALVGDHVKHNVYFKDFPRNVPDTLDFWFDLLRQYFEQTGQLTNNLLDLPGYGTYQHTYEEMVEGHATFKPKKGSVQLKTVLLGKTVSQELNALYAGLAESVVPLNEADRKLLEDLHRAGYYVSTQIPVRENRAIINALQMEVGKPLDADTPIDVLRVAAHLSGGDVTLTEQTKFKAFKRSVRRALVAALDDILEANASKIDDINPYREQFKRLATHLHPHEFAKRYPHAVRAFRFASGDLKIETWGYKVHNAIQNRRITKALSLLSEKPGVLVRSLDKLMRESSDSQFGNLLETLTDSVGRVSGRVLLSLIEHLENRVTESSYRLFVNKAGGGYATASTLKPLGVARLKRVQKVLWTEIAKRTPKGTVTIDPVMANVAVPISEKTKSEGFRVMPRGSILSLDASKPVLRFFIYWHQATQCTDYDLSAAMYDKSFKYVGHISYTCFGWGGYGKEDTYVAVHSGDITSAPKGASEFIDVTLSKLPANCHYILPSIQMFRGDLYKDCKECFFGFMMRDLAERGKPYEARTVQTKFALRGDKRVAVPLVFQRTADGFEVKWLDLYLNGRLACNRVEGNKYSTSLLAKSLVTRKYLTVGQLMETYVAKGRDNKTPVYVGIERPEKTDEDAIVYALDNLKEIIPA